MGLVQDVQFRPAVTADVPAIVAFGDAVIPRHYSPIIGANAAQAQLDWWTPERFNEAIDTGRVQLATVGNQIVGVVETGQMGGEQVIWKLYVAPDVRGQGLGVKLIDHAISALPEETDHVLLEHFEGNSDAARFYEREGFEITGRDVNGSNPNASVVWRRRELQRPGVSLVK
jgi:ribosomal protein S18 acetylase RimI-like enzyme